MFDWLDEIFAMDLSGTGSSVKSDLEDTNGGFSLSLASLFGTFVIALAMVGLLGFDS